MELYFWLVYIVVGIVYSCIMLKMNKLDSSGDFIFRIMAFPVMMGFESIGFILGSIDRHIFINNNRQKLDNTFKFCKKVYILYGKDGAYSKNWDSKILQEYLDLAKSDDIFHIGVFDNTESPITYTNRKGFTKEFYKQLDLEKE